MSNEQNPVEEKVNENTGSDVNTELELLKMQAEDLGIKHHPAIGVKKLSEKIVAFHKAKKKEARKAAQQEAETVPDKPIVRATPIPLDGIPDELVGETPQQKAAKMIRVRVTNMNPNKKEWEGEMYTVSNSEVGTFKKYVPFNTENGWYIPNIIYQYLLEKECQVFYTVKGPRGNKIRKGKQIKELSIEVLPPLTGQEMHELAQQQAMAGTVGTD